MGSIPWGSLMTYSIVSSSVSADASLTTYNVNTSHKKNETAAQAINIGNLNETSSTISVSDKGLESSAAVSTTFTAEMGVTSLSQSFSNFVTEAMTHFQLYDGSNTIIADNQGTTEQQAAFALWVQGGLNLEAGTYTAIATPVTGLPGSPSLTISATEQQGTSLQVSSTLTGSDTSEFYNFSLSGGNIKLDFQTTSKSNAARVVLYNSTGGIVADSAGNAYQRAKYTDLTSGVGLTALSGDYSVKVTYARGANTTKNLDYSMQLYSGNSYAVVYKNKVAAQPYDNTAAGSVTPATDAQLYTHADYNKITGTAATAVNIGWLQQDKSMLDVFSSLTSADHTDYYSFTLQQGDNLKFGFKTSKTKNTTGLRAQLMNSTGSFVIADNYGTPAQQKAYQELTTTKGLTAKTGKYVVKVFYADNATKKDTPYEFGIYSGTTYKAQYKTTASPQTYANAMLRGEVGGAATASALASYLNAVTNGTTADSLTSALQSFV